MEFYEKLIQDCDALIRAGQDQKAERALADFDIPKIPRKWRLPLATLCRRVALIPVGLKILSPIISASNRGAPATSSETAEYAALLQKFGAIEDALRILKDVDVQEAPESLMYRAVCHFSRWEYPESIPLLEKHIAASASEYQALIGRVNLAAALVYSHRFEEVATLLANNIEVCRENNYSRLEGNCHELLTQVHLLNGNLESAKKCLEVAESLLVGPKSLDRLYANRCRAFLTALQEKSIEPLLNFRNEALIWPHAETVRETDLYTLMIKPSEKLHEQLYFGTPFKSYRKRMEELLGSRPARSEMLYGEPTGVILDIVTGEFSNGISVKPGSSVHKVLGALLVDFYRPVRFGSLFGQIFTGEHFDINSSPARVHQSLRRARVWLSENNIPAAIVEENGTYTLRLTGSMSFRLPADRENINRHQSLLATLASAFPNGQSFTAVEAREKLGLKNSAFHRFLQPMLESGQIQKFGASTSTVYFISSELNRVSA